MTLKLTAEMREALQQRPGQPVTVEDEQTHMNYVLVPLHVFERVRALLVDDAFGPADAYAAQSAAAGAAGWDDPEMDVYNSYDANRPTS